VTPFQSAEALADACVPCFPCAASKAPLTRHGFRDATIDHDPAAWAGAALVGIPTGEASGWVVLDIDPAGLEWLAANESRLPITRRVQTRRGGFHLYFQNQAGLRCSAGKIAPAVDFRGEAGFVIAWDRSGYPVQHDTTVATLPGWLAEAARGPNTRDPKAAPRDLADMAAPSADRVVALLDRMPNAESTSRDEWLRIMLAAKGCADAAQDDVGAEDIAEAAIGWSARWPGSAGYDAEREKWESDFALRDSPLSGWPQLLAAADRLKVDTSAERLDTAALEFSTVTPPPSVISSKIL
jgi:hypothetical protein